jgi:S-adenosylmethionine synthetase
MRLFTSESVTPGHPDKLCDQISDFILDEYLAVDPNAHVAVECMATAGGLVIAGEVRSAREPALSHEAAARIVLRSAGYTAASGLDPATWPIQDLVVEQSKEIAAGVDTALEVRDHLIAEVDELDEQGAGDQGMMFGYATRETPQLMPLPISIAHDLAHQLARLRPSSGMLRPDGKTQVTIAYDDLGRPLGIHGILISTQHIPNLDMRQLQRFVVERVVSPVLDKWKRVLPAQQGVRGTKILVNPSGSFVLGGPIADTGLTGRKIIVDTYGGSARHGGGAFSGKDPSKVDRSAAYAMRWVAKNVVAAHLADRCEVQVAYAIGASHPVGLWVDTFGTGAMADSELAEIITRVFDLRPAAIVRDLRLRAPQYAETATFGHFGVHGRAWEATNMTKALLAAAELDDVQGLAAAGA